MHKFELKSTWLGISHDEVVPEQINLIIRDVGDLDDALGAFEDFLRATGFGMDNRHLDIIKEGEST